VFRGGLSQLALGKAFDFAGGEGASAANQIVGARRALDAELGLAVGFVQPGVVTMRLEVLPNIVSAVVFGLAIGYQRAPDLRTVGCPRHDECQFCALQSNGRGWFRTSDLSRVKRAPNGPEEGPKPAFPSGMIHLPPPWT
jgi:hypothetical protein